MRTVLVVLGYILLISYCIVLGIKDDSNTLYYPDTTSGTYACLQNHIYYNSAMDKTIPIFNDEDKPMKCSEWRGEKKLD